MARKLSAIAILCIFLSACSNKSSLICESETEVSPLNPNSSKILISVYRNGDILEVEGEGINYKGKIEIECKEFDKDEFKACREGRKIRISKGSDINNLISFTIYDDTNIFNYRDSYSFGNIRISESAEGICK